MNWTEFAKHTSVFSSGENSALLRDGLALLTCQEREEFWVSQKANHCKLWETLRSKSFCLLGKWIAQRARQWLRAAMWMPHKDFFKEGTGGMVQQGIHTCTVALPAKGPDLKHSSFPLNPAGQEE